MRAGKHKGRTSGLAWGEYFGPPFDPDSFGMRIMAARESRGMTTRELSEKSGLCTVSLYNHQPAKRLRHLARIRYIAPLQSTLIALATALNVPITSLIPDKAPLTDNDIPITDA